MTNQENSRCTTLFNTMFNGAAVIELVLDSEGNPTTYRIIEVNPAFERLTGVFSKDVLGKTYKEIFGTDDAQYFKKYCASYNKKILEEFVGFNHTLRTYFFHCVYPLEQNTLFDIFEKLDDIQSIENRITHTKFIFNATLEGMLVSDMSGKIVYSNRAASEITEYTENELVGQNPRMLKSGHQTTEFYKMMWESLLQHGEWHGEIWNRRKSGEIYPQWNVMSVIRNNRNEIMNFVCVFSDLSPVKVKDTLIRDISYSDFLTKLPNRMAFNYTIESCINNKLAFSLLYIDIDSFKNINDFAGHLIGDTVLIHIAQQLKARVQRSDFLARIGGDEFVIMLIKKTEEEAELFCKSLLQSFEEIIFDEFHFYISFSIGVSRFPRHGKTVVELLKASDIALYDAKSRGKKTYSLYEPIMSDIVSNKSNVEFRMRRAIVNDEFVLYWQPQVDLISRIMTGVEVLLRWNSPDLGFLSADSFIPIAEESGFIVELGTYVFRKTCEQIHNWETSRIALPRISVNFSSKQLEMTNLVKTLTDICLEFNVNPTKLEIELTESVMIRNNKTVDSNLAQLRSLGFLMSIDDFGTGYSSFQYLTKLPVYKIKIDKSFVIGYSDNDNDRSIVKSICDLAKNLKLEVLAEGVETEETITFLIRCGCQFGQGYLISEPIPTEEFVKRFLLKK